MIRVIYLPQSRESAVDITKSVVVVLLTVTLMLPGGGGAECGLEERFPRSVASAAAALL